MVELRKFGYVSPDMNVDHRTYPPGGGTGALLALIESWGFEIRRLRGNGAIGERMPAKDWSDQNAPDVYFDVLAVRAGAVT